MKARSATLIALSAFAVLALSSPPRVLGQQSASPPRLDMTQMMSRMRANDQKLEELVERMNTAQGAAKVDAMAEVLTTLVQDRRAMHESMSDMSTMMDMMRTMHGRGGMMGGQKAN